jgi:GLPGLI family protein
MINLLPCNPPLILWKRNDKIMKTMAIMICVLLLPVAGKSQTPSAKGTISGKISYQERAKIDIKLEGDAAQFANDMPTEQLNNKVLYFNSDYSLYQADETKKEEVSEHQSGVMKIRMMSGGESDRIFCDFKNRKKTEQKEFMTRTFLVEGDLSSSDWKISGNFTTIQGYNCQEATWADSTRKVKAWFTTSIPVSSGPSGYSGLPGLILQLDLNDGKRTITATAIEPVLNDPAILIKPGEGKKVSAAEYKKIVDDKMKEMGVENGEGMKHVIIRYNN